MENSLATASPDNSPARNEARLGLDSLDSLPWWTLPEEIADDEAKRSMLDAATAMAAEGARGKAMARLLAREIQLSRAQLRFAELIRTTEAKRFATGGGNARRLEVAEKLVAGQHRRLLAAIETFSRIGVGLPTRLNVTAHQALVSVGGSA